ncbi:uncharacterized protein N7473_000283 [Penicillium subrubescens]|uniref:uncharacterized protein n=1 Tax=Penicillium subrubescens TaxID=1316194 RepID=UPI0025454708|nr:uncharacterized protein N7473_000283 [Penicillium subrubescens]KAJ5910980.1 hypothetical protein N7473_000283 [Penicillium subrubescens]
MKLIMVLAALVATAIAYPAPEPEPQESCPADKVFNSCGTACPLTCRNFENPPEVCAMTCVPGCACPDDFVLNEAGDSCVVEEDCPKPEPIDGTGDV